MVKIIRPVEVSPIIKTARWAFLIYGILYGSWRMRSLRAFEETEHVIRENKLKLQHELFVKETRDKTLAEIMDLGREFEVKEFPPGWDSEL